MTAKNQGMSPLFPEQPTFAPLLDVRPLRPASLTLSAGHGKRVVGAVKPGPSPTYVNIDVNLG